MTTQRDEAWFDSLYRSCHGQVLAYARRRVAEPDDLVSDVFTAAWRHRDRVPDPALPWLLRTASNLALHAARGDRRRNRLQAKLSAHRVGPIGDHADAVADRSTATTTVLAALQAMSATDQELLRLAAWEQLPIAEIAYVLGRSEAAIRVRLHRARGRLARAVSQVQQDETQLFSPSTEVRT